MNASTYVLVGDTLSDVCAETLRKLGFRPIFLPPYERLGRQVASHADMLLFPIGNEIFTFGEYADALPCLYRIAEEKGRRLVTVEKLPKESYPNDVLLNCLYVGRRIFAKESAIADEVVAYAKKNGIGIINIKQGYARCTACPLSESAIITADKNISRAARAEGMDVLEISEGGVLLDGYPYGFIGGACGVFKDKIYFAGDLLSHPDGQAISEFCVKHGMTPVSLSHEPLKDVGSMFFIS